MISKRDKKYLAVAEAVSALSDYPRIKIGACVVGNGDILSTGFNMRKTHPVQKQYNTHMPYEVRTPFLHAEISALLKLPGTMKPSTIYVFRKSNDGTQRNCNPCKACRQYIIDKGIKRIVWTTETGICEEHIIRKRGV